MDRYDFLIRKNKRRTAAENQELEPLYEFMEQARPIGGPPAPDSLDAKIDAFLEEKLNDQGRAPVEA
jgi:hypothetical protein